MSRELILIPKMRYDFLMKNEQSKLENKPNLNEDVNEQNSNGQFEKLENVSNEPDLNVEVSDTEKLNQDSIPDNIKTKKRERVEKRTKRIQKGKGRSYVKMSPLQFSNEEKLTLKNKWLSFPI